MNTSRDHIIVKNLTVGYGSTVIQRDISFTVRRGEIFVIMGESGCGKSTILRSMVGLLKPVAGQVLYDQVSFWESGPTAQRRIIRSFGISYQGGALWSSLTVGENVALPLRQYTDLGMDTIAELVSLKLSLVGLAGTEDYYPSEISGGMRKRAGIARAIALDPEILFFDEPSSGLDPVNAHMLDKLITELRDSLGTTIVVVTHDLASIFAIANDSVFLDSETNTMIATGNPKELLAASPDPRVLNFLTRGDGTAGKTGER